MVVSVTRREPSCARVSHVALARYGHYPFDLATRPDYGFRTTTTAPAASTSAPETLNRV